MFAAITSFFLRPKAVDVAPARRNTNSAAHSPSQPPAAPPSPKQRLCPTLFLIVILCCLPQLSPAEDQTQPTIQSMIGGFLFGSDHSYMAESSVHLPILRLEPFSLSYRQHEVTPVLKEGGQTQLLNSRYQIIADLTAGEYLRLISTAAYHQTALEDRPGSLSAYEIGLGLGSPLRPQLPQLDWSVVAGGYLGRERLDADWWADLHFSWRVHQFEDGHMLDTTFQPSLSLALDIDSSNDGTRIHALYKVGPVLDLMSANGNRARFHTRWYANDGNPFFETRHSGLLIGMEIHSSLEKDPLFDPRNQRTKGWLPLVWGQYDVGYGGDRSIQRTELNTEIHDFILAEHMVTAVLWYESRQEYQTGDFDNVSYSVSLGGQTEIGLASPLSQGKPLVLGLDYLHRSSHALDPDANRVPPNRTLEHNSINLAPRFRLQTVGWNLPYRDPSVYFAKAAWLHDLDWRITIGYDFYHSRQRRNPAAQFGLNWDVAALQGSVIYARGLGSIGNETPDWLGEFGVRRRNGKFFLRFARYGLEQNLAHGNTAVIGFGFHL